jgi:hypothetical protein
MPKAKKTPQEAQLLHLPPFAIGRETAAAACGVAVSTFDGAGCGPGYTGC